MEGSPRAAAAAAAPPPPLPQAPHPEFDRRPTPKPGEGRPPRPPDREAAPRGLRLVGPAVRLDVARATENGEKKKGSGARAYSGVGGDEGGANWD